MWGNLGIKNQLTFSLILIIVVSSSIAFVSADGGPGPSIPTGNNTVTQYCYYGVCSTSGIQITLNATKGFFTPGNYPGGIKLDKSTLIGVQLSQSCIKLEINHMKNNCLSYFQVKSVDTTNPNYAGKWVNDTWYHRLLPTTKQSWNFQTGKFVVMVDPDPDFTARARMITMQDSNFTFINPNDVNTNHTRFEYHNRYVPADCSGATIAPIPSLLNDTINYLESGCKITKFKDVTTSSTPYYGIYYDTGIVKSYIWLNHFSNVTRLSNCITEKCSLPVNPYHNHDSKFGW